MARLSLPHISLKTKLVLAFGLVASAVAVVSFLNVASIRVVHASFSEIVETDVPRLQSMERMRFLSAEVRSQTLAYLYRLDSNTSVSSAETQKNELLVALEAMEGWRHDHDLLIAGHEQEERGHDENEAAAAQQQADRVTRAKDEVVGDAFALVSYREQQAAESVVAAQIQKLTVSQQQMGAVIDDVIEQELAQAAEEAAIAEKQVTSVVREAIISSVVAALAAVGLGLAISISIGRNLQKLRQGAGALATGNFSLQLEINSRDELQDLAVAFSQMAARLRDSYHRLELEGLRNKAVLQSMSEGLVAVDDEGRIVLINGIARDLLGLPSRQHLLGESFTDRVVLYDEQNDELPIKSQPTTRVIQNSHHFNEVYSVRNEQGGRVLVSASLAPIVIGRSTAGAIVVLRDVTKEKEVDRMKTEFISLASHQLRTPLSAIKWFSEMLLNGDVGKLTKEQVDFAHNIYDSTARMIELVSSLLNISRMESGRIQIDPRPTDLSELLSGIINDLKAKTSAKNQQLAISIHPNLPKINLDPHLMGQVYMNLLTNAIKYTPADGEITVFVSRRGNKIISQVSDTGYGIPKAEQKKLFQKFFRAQNVAKIETDGTGLGLYLVKAIIETSGGQIRYKSEEGKGTTFWVTFPVSGMKAKKGEVALDA